MTKWWVDNLRKNPNSDHPLTKSVIYLFLIFNLSHNVNLHTTQDNFFIAFFSSYYKEPLQVKFDLNMSNENL